jgi:hypothetical protein
MVFNLPILSISKLFTMKVASTGKRRGGEEKGRCAAKVPVREHLPLCRNI